jgi:hypothetical protein
MIVRLVSSATVGATVAAFERTTADCIFPDEG